MQDDAGTACRTSNSDCRKCVKYRKGKNRVYAGACDPDLCDRGYAGKMFG